MSNPNTQLINEYRSCKNLGQAARSVGMNALSAYKILAMSGALTMRDRCTIGTRSSQLGAKAELEFQRLVPYAKLQNCDEYQRKDFDFLLPNGMTVDIKARRKQSDNNGFAFTLQRHYQDSKSADFYVLFALQGEEITDGYDLFVVPAQIAEDVKTISYSCRTRDKHWLFDYKIEPEALMGFFDFGEAL